MPRRLFFSFAFAIAFLVLNSTAIVKAEIIVDNFSEEGPNGFGLSHPFFGSTTWAQQFKTNGNDYRLDKVSVRVRSTANAALEVKLWSGGTFPQIELATMSLANTPTVGVFDTYEYVSSTPLMLDGGTDYFFSIGAVGGASSWAGSEFGTNQFTGSGTLLDRVVASNNGGASWSNGTTNHAVIRVEGTLQAFATPEPSALVYGTLILVGAGLRRRR